MSEPRELARHFVVYGPELAAETVPVTDSLWADIDDRFGAFEGSSLVSTFSFDEPWPTWEMHPAGDEFVYLLDGDTELVFASSAAEEVLRLSRPGQYVIVPRGTWHTARPKRSTRLLFVTPGQGTENREKLPWQDGQA